MSKDVDESVRPWGHYEILLDTKYCKVKRIVVKPFTKVELSISSSQARGLDYCSRSKAEGDTK